MSYRNRYKKDLTCLTKLYTELTISQAKRGKRGSAVFTAVQLSGVPWLACVTAAYPDSFMKYLRASLEHAVEHGVGVWDTELDTFCSEYVREHPEVVKDLKEVGERLGRRLEKFFRPFPSRLYSR